MSNLNQTSTLTKKSPRSILMNKNRDQSRTDPVNENLIQQSNLLDETYQLNPSTNFNILDYQQQSTNYLNSILNQVPSNQVSSNQVPSNQLTSNQLTSNQLTSNQIPSNQLTSNQPPIIYESQLIFNPVTGQHEQQLVTCEQYYNNLNQDQSSKEYTGCLSSFVKYDFQLSIDNWRRNLLILILIVNAIMAVVNAAIIIWIISYYYLSFNKIIDFSSNKIVLRGDAHFEKSLQLKSLSSIEDELLSISSNNIIAQDPKTLVSLSLNRTGEIVGQANKFELKNKDGKTQMMINGSQFFLQSDKITINNDHQLNLGKSIQTKQLSSQTNLNIISLNRKLQIETSGLINVKSKHNLNLINNSTDHLQLITKNGKIYLNASTIEIFNLHSYIPSKTGSLYPDIYQLCICKNGKLFTDTADGLCFAEQSMCQSP